MNITDILWRLILGPIVLLIDTVYSVSVQLTSSPGFSLILLSLAVNLLVLPLYKRADAIQEEERRISAKLQPVVDHIRKVYKGDERVMMTRMYYRENHYKPIYALKSMLPLLLQVPFFIAAYNYLSNLRLLQGVAFGPIKDLGAPDGLLRIAGITVNVLPVLMTLINIASGALYTRGMPLKSKIQLYGMAALFLVLLYNSPAALVFYWTLNNLFSLLKNAVGRRNLKPFLRCFAGALGLFLAVWYLGLRPAESIRRKAIVALDALALQLPWLTYALRNTPVMKAIRKFFAVFRPGRENNAKQSKAAGNDAKTSDTAGKTATAVFTVSCCILTILTGLLIPSAVISASPAEFVDVRNLSSPLKYLLPPLLTAAGLFLLWCGVYYRLASDKTRRWYPPAFAAAALGGIVNFMFFGGDYGNLNSNLKYDTTISVRTVAPFVVNTLVLLALAGLVFLLWKKRKAAVSALCFAAALALLVQTGMNVHTIRNRYSEISRATFRSTDEKPTLLLDKKGRNVVVLMLDRGISGFAPFIFEERPDVREQFAGFTWYPNTISYGAHTNVGSPALYGGYDYTPDHIMERDDVSLKDKQNEALKIMPVNFMENGFTATLCDPPYANYQRTPDLSAFDDMPELRTFNTHGTYYAEAEDSAEELEHRRDRNLFCYAFMRAAPALHHADLYNFGNYNDADMNSHHRLELLDKTFTDAYLVMKHLPDMSVLTEDGQDTFLALCNIMTHDVVYLQGPDYDPQIVDPDSTWEEEHAVRRDAEGRELRLTTEMQQTHYDCNMAAYILLGKWFDFLRENGVYDNTRIIVVSDHGGPLSLNEQLLGFEPSPDFEEPMYMNSLLMIKDFGETAPVRTDGAFMTVSDVPTLAFRGLVESPKNPFLNTPVTDAEKQNPEQHICLTEWNVELNHGNTFADPTFVTLRNQDIFNPENWSLGE